MNTVPNALMGSS